MAEQTKQESYLFQFSPYNVEKLLPQVSKALEKRTEMISRERYPKLWKQTDKLNAVSSVSGGRKRSTVFRKILSVFLILMGVFLFIPGLMKPQELMIPLIAGGFGLVIGISGLFSGTRKRSGSRKAKTNPYDKSAELLLEGKDTELPETMEIIFSEEGMQIRSGSDESEPVPYSLFERIVEAEDCMLFVYEEKVMLLQKCDLKNSTIEAFCEFCAEKVEKYHVI